RIGSNLVQSNRRSAPGDLSPKDGWTWQRVFAVCGIVAAFACGIIVWGFVALNGYSKWRRGQKDRPKLAFFFATVFVSFFPAAIVAELVTALGGHPADQIGDTSLAIVTTLSVIVGVIAAFKLPIEGRIAFRSFTPPA